MVISMLFHCSLMFFLQLPEGQMRFKTYGADQGLTNNSLWVLEQDKDGFIWVGSEAGLFRYEGSEFEFFGRDHGLPSAEITALHIGPKQELWVGTRQGAAFWDGNVFQTLNGPSSRVQKITNDGKKVWVATEAGLFYFDGTWSKDEHFPFDEVSAVHFGQSSGLLFASGWSGSAKLFKLENGQWLEFGGAPEFFLERISAIAEDSSGRVWARSPRNLWVCEAETSRFKKSDAPFPIVSSHGYLRLEQNGGLLIPTDQGLVRFKDQDWSIISPAEGLPTAWSRDALVDQEGTLWIASAGLLRVLGRGVWRAYTQENWLTSEVVWHIFQHQGSLYCGTDQGLFKAQSSGWDLVAGTQNNVIRSSTALPDGRLLLVGFPTNEFLIFDPESGFVEQVSFAIDPLPRRLFRVMLASSGTIWLCTDGSGLYQTQPNNLDALKRVELPGSHETDVVGDVKQDADGNIWVTSHNGIYVNSNGTWFNFTTQDGLAGNETAGLTRMQDNRMLISYSEPIGLSIASFREGTFEVEMHPATDTLPKDRVYLTGQDSQKRLWIGTGRGVYLWDEGTVEHFGLAEGLVGEDCNNMAFYEGQEGHVWIGTSVGLARFHADQYSGPIKPPKVEFVSISLGKRNYEVDEFPNVPYHERTLEVRFAGMSFVNERAVEHRIRLRGLEDEWVLTDSRTARFPALPHGSYTFEASARIGRGEWGPISDFSFSVAPAWWQTWWFLTLEILLVLGLIGLVVKWRMVALKQQNTLLESLVASRTSELEQANAALNDANEALRNQSLTDPLTGLRNRRFLNVCMPEDVAQVKRTHRDLHGERIQRLTQNVDILFIMVDMDHFKSVNDEYGHAAGDTVLQQVSTILGKATRDSDTIIRWGGEEFLIVARNSCRLDYRTVLERIRTRIEEHPFELGEGRTIHRTCSLGFAYFPFLLDHPDKLDWEHVVDLADRSLYAAKRGGRNAWVGLFSTSEEMPAGGILDVEQLLADGVLEVTTSLPDATVLDWNIG